MPTISIIVPVYNVEKYLCCCVDSILAQTFADIEVLLVDDGSTDGSSVICDKYAEIDSRVRVFHKKNGGVSSARNLGLDEARGKWIMFVDSDDKVSPEICKQLLAHAKDGCLTICMCYEWKDNEIKARSLNVEKGYYTIERFPEIKAYGPWARLYERQLLEHAKLRFDERFAYAEDTIFNFDYYSLINGFVIMDEPLYYYRILPSSLSHGRFIPNLDSIIKELYHKELHLAEYLNINDKEFYREYYSNYFYLMHFLFENNMRKDALGTWLEKIHRNNTVLRSEEFKEVYNYRYERPNDFTKRYIRMLELSYYTGSYFWLWLVGVPGKIKDLSKKRVSQ